jgi:hypothetical protein
MIVFKIPFTLFYKGNSSGPAEIKNQLFFIKCSIHAAYVGYLQNSINAIKRTP